MTERLYYNDGYLTAFSATVVAAENEGRRVYLDRTAFYPTSGGQPHDVGTLAGIRVSDVVDEGERIAHVLEAPVSGAGVEGSVDWARRFDHMQQHTGQHLLSAVLEELYRMPTVSFHLGAETSTIELGTAELTREQVVEAERVCNERIGEGRRVTVGYEDSASAGELRKASARSGTLRIVSIEGMDRSACGGTHVRSTAEIGMVLLRRQERIRGNVRLEFLCGGRALRQARADYETLGAAAKLLGSAAAEVPPLVAALQERVNVAERERRRLSLALASIEGRRLYAAAEPDANGVRRHVERRKAGAVDDELRAMAQSFTAGAKAVFVALVEAERVLLLASSKDSGVLCGAVLKKVLADVGGRGGGSPQMAQGSVPAAGEWPRAVTLLDAALGCDTV